MRHFLAYGNSDQVSFRDNEVRDAFDYMTVPGTIAAYYEDATAAFVLSSDLKYAIDPRTPLFQENLPAPRASHFTLAEWMGPAVSKHLAANQAGASFPPTFYSDAVVKEIVASLVDRQQDYSKRAPMVKQKMDRYRALLAKASGQSSTDIPEAKVRKPKFILAPYFAVRDLANDPWADINRRIWTECLGRPDASSISPVVAVASVNELGTALDQMPVGLSDTRFFWVTDFDERQVSQTELESLWHTVASRSDSFRLVNLYGGFFSICMQHAGLFGFNNGLGYSESRAWPQLTSTGAAPPRYYIKGLHAFASPAAAELLISIDPRFGCNCSACSGTTPVDMSYHLLKRHFALTRKWEIDLVDRRTVTQLAEHLEKWHSRFRAAKPGLPVATAQSLKAKQLNTWAQVLRAV